MPVIDFEEWKKRYAQSPPKRPAVVTFYGAFHADRTGNLRSLTISIMVDDGDWSELMENVMENGGVGGENDDGEPFFLPWPCAAVDVHYPDQPESDNSNQV
jgi:hypothetical protein